MARARDLAVRVRASRRDKWEWVGDLGRLTSRKSEAFIYPANYPDSRQVAEEVAERARKAGLIPEIVEM